MQRQFEVIQQRQAVERHHAASELYPAIKAIKCRFFVLDLPVFNIAIRVFTSGL